MVRALDLDACRAEPVSAVEKALVAHEIGHEYVWQQFADARGCNDMKRLRE